MQSRCSSETLSMVISAALITPKCSSGSAPMFLSLMAISVDLSGSFSVSAIGVFGGRVASSSRVIRRLRRQRYYAQHILRRFDGLPPNFQSFLQLLLLLIIPYAAASSPRWGPSAVTCGSTEGLCLELGRLQAQHRSRTQGGHE